MTPDQKAKATEGCKTRALSVLRRLGVPSRDCEDVFCEARLKVLLTGYEGTEFDAWFLSVVSNAGKNHLRRKSRRPEVLFCEEYEERD